MKIFMRRKKERKTKEKELFANYSNYSMNSIETLNLFFYFLINLIFIINQINPFLEPRFQRKFELYIYFRCKYLSFLCIPKYKRKFLQ
jgi:hypothetical protein